MSHHVSASTASGATSGISASVLPFARMVIVPSCWPFSTGAVTDSATSTLDSTCEASALSISTGCVSCASGVTVSARPSTTGTAGMSTSAGGCASA